ncbi:MAG TPA: 4Fe-4S dicluster domain-containing protein [Rhizomicrobium sp.]|nr:4Fe-4S dicluster domain-containing protein [Rhizomicrobium sp.]
MTIQSVQKAIVPPDHIPEWDNPQEAIFHRVEIDLSICDGCKICTVVCPANVLELYGPKTALKARVKEDATGCMSCNNCYAICAGKAIIATQPYDFAGLYEQKRIGEFCFPRKF